MALDNNTVLNYTDKNTIKNWFKTGLKPNQQQFWNTWDSFWHKDEKLPISSVEGLGVAIDGKAEANHSHSNYATNDANSLDITNIEQWKEKLGVANLEFDDQAITITQSFPEFGLEEGSTIKQFHSAIYSEVKNKLNAPTENATNEYVLLADGTTAPKTDFGKVDTVMGVQAGANKNVDISGVAMNWTNDNHRFSGLVDKSADATYNALMGLDSGGNVGKLTALGNVLESGLQTISSTQALRISQLLNGGQGSSGAISVNLISPPIVQNRFDSVEYVLLRGANLLLNSTDMSISICDENKNVIQQIPNNQIINNSNLELIFYYNFYQFAIGTYYIKITSGVKVYYTTLDLRVVQEVENINFNEITWQKIYAEGVTAPSVDEAINQNVMQRAIITSGNTTNVLSSFKSSELFALGENFSIEYMLILNQTNSSGAGTATARVFAGLGYSNTPNALINNSIIYHHVSGTYTNGNAIGINGSVYDTALVTPHNTIVTITKVGNLFRITIGSVTRSFTLSNNSGYSMFIQSNGSLKGLEQQIQITKAFKFD